jgi:hypothetical protein
MKRTIPAASLWGSILLLASICSFSQTIETIGGVWTVHNVKGGKPGFSIQLIRKIGDIDSLDENLAFNFPSDIAMDAVGNIYILDSDNHRIQKFHSNGTYGATFGRRGQGPGEFNNPDSMDIDAHGVFFVLDLSQKRIQTLTPQGKGDRTIHIIRIIPEKLRCLKSGLLAAKGVYSFTDRIQPPKLLILDQDGKPLKSFVDIVDYSDEYKTIYANLFDYTVDTNDNFYIAYSFRNKIEKYRSDGKLLWKADWPLDFSPGSWGSDFTAETMNACSIGIASDVKGRVWVVTLERPLRKEEKVKKGTMALGSGGSVTSITRIVNGNTDLRTSDCYKLEIFDADGILLGGIRLTHFVDAIRIIGNNLFLLDQVRGATFYHYKIIEKP